ncbi:MAG: sulfatase-like hydrolase/transferase [Pseudomonas sp.]
MFAAIACLFLVGLAGCNDKPAVEGAVRPNILLILTDDLGNNDIASWGDGLAPTPTLDSLSQASVRFRRHYTDSTCSPSRASLLTGQHALNLGFQPTGLGLSSDLPNLPRSLRDLGYRTAHIGKWHVGEALEYPQIQPGKLGFDYWLGFLNHFVLRGPGPGGEVVRRRPTHIDPWLQESGQPPVQHKGYLDDVLTDKAIELIGQKRGQPWFINLWLYSPHTPYQPSPEFKAQFPDTPEGRYLAVLKQLDHNVQRLLSELKARGLDDNTLVVFASDNGGTNQARDNNFPLEGQKNTYLEGGVRSPLFIHWPGHFENADIDSVTHITDLYPTLLALAGGQVPSGLMGRDLGPVLRGGRPPERGQLFWAADSGPAGMIYAGAHFAEQRFFYRDLRGRTSTRAISGAIGAAPGKAIVPLAIETDQQSTEIAAWEREVRRINVAWHPAQGSKPAYLSGLDLQRAPVFGGFSLGLALSAPSVGKGRQVLVEQAGVWGLSLESDGRLRLHHGDHELYSEPVVLGASCNSLVASFDIQAAPSYPMPRAASSRAVLYLNGHAVLDSSALLVRPLAEQPLTNPTFIGNDVASTSPFLGQIGKPLLVGKLLLPQQEGYALTDLQAELCAP